MICSKFHETFSNEIKVCEPEDEEICDDLISQVK